jgi:hypothetical protein
VQGDGEGPSGSRRDMSIKGEKKIEGEGRSGGASGLSLLRGLPSTRHPAIAIARPQTHPLDDRVWEGELGYDATRRDVCSPTNNTRVFRPSIDTWGETRGSMITLPTPLLEIDRQSMGDRQLVSQTRGPLATHWGRGHIWEGRNKPSTTDFISDEVARRTQPDITRSPGRHHRMCAE